MRRIASFLLPALLLLTGCTGPAALTGALEGADCALLLKRVERQVRLHGVGDAGARPVPGFPYLRTDRFLASWRKEVGEGPAFGEWVRWMRRLDREARKFELANLPASSRAELDRAAGGDALATLEYCARHRLRRELAHPRRRAALRRAAVVPDDYRGWKRVLGFYPLVAPFLRSGIDRWHRRLLTLHALPPDALPVRGRLVRYGPPVGQGVVLPGTFPRDGLGIPMPDPARLEALFAAHAPLLEVDSAGPADGIGAPVWEREGRIRIDGARPVAYRRLSYTRLGHRVLLQLNYLFWFPERPRKGAFDLLGGHLDGLIWRVTLGPDGRPWVYDSIHPCGCWHLFFPTRRATIPLPPAGLEERAFIPAAAPAPAPGERLLLRVSSGEHQIIHLGIATGAVDRPWSWGWMRELRSLPLPSGDRRSLYGPDGLVAGTERAERLLFWPSGIPSPGAMRQWGHHATAFIGRRHFDDPFLIARSFLWAPP